MNLKAILIFILGLVLAAGAIYYRRHHFAKSIVVVHAPLDPARSPSPIPPHSAELDRTLETVKEVNRINRMNREKREPPIQPRQEPSTPQ